MILYDLLPAFFFEKLRKLFKYCKAMLKTDHRNHNNQRQKNENIIAIIDCFKVLHRVRHSVSQWKYLQIRK
jgi:hypothetical protein